jgi:hypothetical protein
MAICAGGAYCFLLHFQNGGFDVTTLTVGLNGGNSRSRVYYEYNRIHINSQQ